MAITFISRDERTAVFLWQIEDDADYLLQCAALSPQEEQQYRAFRAESRKKQWLAVRALANKALGEKAVISYTSSGRPVLDSSSQFISISHSNKYAAIALGDDPRLGVDVESLTRKYSQIRHKYVSDADADAFKEVGMDEKLFLPIVWSVKEAAFKAAHYADVDFIRDIVVSKVVANDAHSEGEVFVEFCPLAINGFFKFSIFDSHVIAWGTYEGI